MVIFIGTLLTQVMSNAASVALLAPVAVQLAPSLAPPHRHADHSVVWSKPVVPGPRGVSNQPDGVRPGRYRFLDVTRYGNGLTLIMTLLVPALVLWRYGPS